MPTYNEKGNILSLVEQIHKNILEYQHEIIVVDDNSPDGTYDYLIQGNLPYIKPILRLKNPGLANSIRCGIENSFGSTIIIMDSDFAHPPETLSFMVQSMSDYECVMGSRFLYGGKGSNERRHLLSWIFNIFLRIILNGAITDNLYGYFVIKKKLLSNLNYDNIFSGFGEYSIRLLYYLQRQGIKILQVPVVTGDRMYGIGNQNFIKVFIDYSKVAMKLILKEGRLKEKNPFP